MISRRALLPLLASAPVLAAAPVGAQPDPAAVLRGGRWDLQTRNGAPAETGANGAVPWLRFEPPRFSGFAGCNRVIGTFRMSERRFVFDSDMVLTKMFCADHMAVEQRFLAALWQVREWSHANGQLALIGRASDLVFRRVSEPDKR